MPLLARVGNHFSQLLHHLIYSFPSPHNGTELEWDDGNDVGYGDATNSTGANTTMRIAKFLAEPGEDKAFAQGVGPLSFFGSGYGVTLVLIGILLNRIHHIVRRPRPPPPPGPHPPVNSLYWRARRAVMAGLTSHDAPRYVRIPGVIALVRAWLLFSILTLQVANLWPDESSRIGRSILGHVILKFGHWAGDMSMDKVCWQVFLSVCLGLVCSALANGLDRAHRQDVGAGFNLVGAIMPIDRDPLVFSKFMRTMMARGAVQPTHHGRPDMHALFQMWLSLTELTWLQTMETASTGRRNQLLPTAVCGTLGLGHFIYALATSPFKFPSFTFLTHLFALFLAIVIICSMIAKAFLLLFTHGHIPSPMFGNLLPHFTFVPSIEDDFGIALLKIGTACLETTQYSGLRNELAPIESRPGPWIELSASTNAIGKPAGWDMGGFRTEVTRIEVEKMDDPAAMTSRYTRERTVFLKAFGKLLLNLLLSLPGVHTVMQTANRLYHARWWYGPRRVRFWRRDAWRYVRPVRPADMQARHARFQNHVENARRIREAAAAVDFASSSGATTTALQLHPDRHDMTYRELFEGQDWADDEQEWEDESSGSNSSGSDTEGEDDQALYRDLLAEQPEEDDIQPVLLAHLTAHTSSPLTRRRYNALITTPTKNARGIVDSGAMEDVVYDRREMALSKRSASGQAADDWDDDRRKSCVVCTIEPRDTILWPCRCLAICDECRENLAARLSAKEHMCPCCRRKVDGYSRIYIP